MQAKCAMQYENAQLYKDATQQYEIETMYENYVSREEKIQCIPVLSRCYFKEFVML